MISMTLFRSLLMNSQVSVAQTQGRNRLLGPWNQFLQMQWFLWWWLRMATEQNSHALPKPRIASRPNTIRPALPKIIKVFLIFCAHKCEGQRPLSLWRTHRQKKSPDGECSDTISEAGIQEEYPSKAWKQAIESGTAGAFLAGRNGVSSKPWTVHGSAMQKVCILL